jgi:hypothetical protein
VTLERYIRALAVIPDTKEPVRDGDYPNDRGIVGYWAKYKVGNDWLWYSVSDTSGSIVLPTTVLNAIAKGVLQRAGSFKGNGFEATFRFDGQSFMLGLGSKVPRFMK